MPSPLERILGAAAALAAAAMVATAAPPVRAAGDWKPAASPLFTSWGRAVRAETPRPDYPRPTALRKEWQSLNGLWQFAFDDAGVGQSQRWFEGGRRFPLQILVPFSYESALSGIGRGAEIHERVWYRRSFKVPRRWSDRRVVLHFNACDWETTVWVNGTQVGSHRGGYVPFSFDVTEQLRPSGEQELVVAAYDPADPEKGAYQPKGKQLGSRGIWYTRTTGIWQSVWMEPVVLGGTASLRVASQANPAARTGEVLVTVRRTAPIRAEIEVAVGRRGRHAAALRVTTADREVRARLRITGVDLWSPEHPALYDVTVRVVQDGRQVDVVESYTAFRHYGIQGGHLTLNGSRYFLRGVLDQGYWPDGVLTPPSDAAIRAEVETTRALGFNMARKHVKVEDPRWYYWCDRLGLIVWQDMPSSHNLQSAAARENFRREWEAVVEHVSGHPSVVHWIPFNENWGNPGEFQDEIVRLTRSLDPGRPITDASGWTQRALTDVIDIHDYGNNLARHSEVNPARPKVIGEYGGIALPVAGHTWTAGWGYQSVRTPEQLLRRIAMQTSQLHRAAGISGFVYTQLTDVEQELNGLLTYDRRPKASLRAIADVFEGRRLYDGQRGLVREWLVLGPIPTQAGLSSPQDTPDNRARMKGALDVPHLGDEAGLAPREGDAVTIQGREYRWRKVERASGEVDLHEVFPGGARNAVAYAVATVPGQAGTMHRLLLGSDDGYRAWVNGRLAASGDRIRGVSRDEDEVEGLILRPGGNSLILKIGQGVGGWGFVARIEPVEERRGGRKER